MVIIDRPNRALIATAVCAAGFIGAASWFGYNEIARDFRGHLAVTLRSVLNSTQQAAHAWAEHERAEALAWAESPEVVEQTQRVLREPRTHAALNASPAQNLLRLCLNGASHTRGHIGFLVISRDSVIVGASDEADLGRRVVPGNRPAAFASAWNGETVVSVPRGGAGGSSALQGTFSLAPIRDRENEVVAVLALRLDPARDFSDLFQPSRVVPTAEAFAFDRHGRLLSTGYASRKNGKHKSAVSDTLVSVGAQWFGPMADSQPNGGQAGKDGPPTVISIAQGDTGVNLRGFTRSDGVNVIGAWTWDDDLGFGIAAELDSEMAYEPLTLTRNILIGLSVLSMLLVVSAILSGRRTKQLETLLEGIPLGMLLVDGTGVVRRANAGAGKLLGYTQQQLAGKPVSDLIPEHLRTGHVKLHADFMRQPVARRMVNERQVVALHADGSVIDVEITLAPLRIAGDPLVLAMLWDIGHRLAMERALRERTEELARSNRDLEQFAYVASHDLRAPLRGIAHLADWLEAELTPGAGPESGHYLSLMRNRVRRMDGLLSSLLEYARASKSVNPAEPVDVERLVRDLAALLDWKSAFELRVSGTPPTLLTDSAALQQVLLNVMGNAVKHHDRNTGLVEITWRNADDAHEFLVSDDGPGIPEDMRNKAFEMFQTLRPRDEVEGSGMGLALVKLITERRGGTVTIESHEPRGTTIRILWPKMAVNRSLES